MSESKVLSQDEIDALLGNTAPAAPDGTAPVAVAAPAAPPPPPKPPAVVQVAAPAAPAAAGGALGGLSLIPDASGMVKLVSASAVAGPVIAPPQGAPAVQGGRHEALPQLDTTGAAAMAAAHFKKDVDDLRHRMEKIEKSLQKMDALEKRVDQLVEAVRKVAGSIPKGVDKQVQVIWQGLQNTPDYNLYEKFVCKSCGTAGAAQIKSRCGHCGTEGWFGRREAKPPVLLAAPPPAIAPRPVAKAPVKPPVKPPPKKK